MSMMTFFKIRSKISGLFSNGGADPSFVKTGKVWKRKGDLSSHFSNLSAYGRRIYQNVDAEVVEIEVREECLSSTPVEQWLVAVDQRAAAREAAKQKARTEYELERDRQTLERIRRQWGDKL